MDEQKELKAEWMKRPKKRWIGGVCSGLGEKYKLKPIIFRILFVLCTAVLKIFFMFPILIYLLLWIIIPNSKLIPVAEKKRQYTIQSLLGIIGAIIGSGLGYYFGVIQVGNDVSGFLVIIIFFVLGLVAGAVAGFSIARYLSENKSIR